MVERTSDSYGQTFSSVRQRPESGRDPALANDRPLLPRGLKQPRRSSPRLQSFDYTGPYAYSLTINTDSGRPHFSDARFVAFCIEALQEKASVHVFEVVAFCFMPNHVHLLVAGLNESSRLKPFMQQFKQVTGYAFKQEHSALLWHRSYHDRVLRKDEDLLSVAAYIWANPVRAGLAQNPGDYPYSGPTERPLGEAGRSGDEATLGGQSLSSVRTNPTPRPAQA